MDKRLSRRLDKVEKRLIPEEENVVPVVIICRDGGDHRGKGVVVIGGDSKKRGNEVDETERK